MENEITELLGRLTQTQEQLLALLTKKREHLVSGDHGAIAALAPEEQRLAEELQACQQQRESLLADAAGRGLPNASITDLAASLPDAAGQKLRAPIESAREKSQLLRHESLSHWVAMQRSVLHLSHMLEIIATGGRSRPTYDKGRTPESSGSLMDQAV
ncbi:MAG: flagellar export chaperone FlgN [Planctomycetota bacterium]